AFPEEAKTGTMEIIYLRSLKVYEKASGSFEEITCLISPTNPERIEYGKTFKHFSPETIPTFRCCCINSLADSDKKLINPARLMFIICGVLPEIPFNPETEPWRPVLLLL